MKKKANTETLYNEFANAKKQQKTIWIASMAFLLFAFIAVLFFAGYWMGKVVVVKENGQRVDAAILDQEETFKAQASLLIDRAFSFANSGDRFTYRDNQAKTLFLMDARSANRIFKAYEKQKVYADMLSKGTVYSASIDPKSIEIFGNSEPFNCRFTGWITIKENGTLTKFKADCSGKLIYYTPNYPYNPHGFFLTEYVQNTIRHEETR